jgi:hypothetical protein
MSAPISGTATISSIAYSGIMKQGGGGSAPSPYLINNGYYALTTSNANVFTQVVGTGAYTSSFIRLLVKSNGPQGSNGDVGSVVTLYTVWDEVPNNLTVGSGSTVTVTAQAPEVTNLANTWGAITIAGSVTGS